MPKKEAYDLQGLGNAYVRMTSVHRRLGEFIAAIGRCAFFGSLFDPTSRIMVQTESYFSDRSFAQGFPKDGAYIARVNASEAGIFVSLGGLLLTFGERVSPFVIRLEADSTLSVSGGMAVSSVVNQGCFADLKNFFVQYANIPFQVADKTFPFIGLPTQVSYSQFEALTKKTNLQLV